MKLLLTEEPQATVSPEAALVMVGGVVLVTQNWAEVVEVLPQLSLAVNTTVTHPQADGATPLELFVQVTVVLQLPVAVAPPLLLNHDVKLPATDEPQATLSLLAFLVMVGGVVLVVQNCAEVVAVLPQLSDAVNTTVTHWQADGATPLELSDHVMLLQLSVAVAPP